MKINTKLTSANQRQEETIVALKKVYILFKSHFICVAENAFAQKIFNLNQKYIFCFGCVVALC